MLATFGAYAGLLATAFGAATLLPLQSEAVLSLLLASGLYSNAGLLFVASAGNILGSLLNWWLGRTLETYRDKPWFPVSAKHLERAQRTYSRYGSGTLLLSWVPVIGDPLTLIAGVMREPLWRFLLLVTLAKTGRYLAVMAAVNAW